MIKPRYRIYATLLDAFTRYQSEETDASFKELISKINRVYVVKPAAAEGTALNDIIDDPVAIPVKKIKKIFIPGQKGQHTAEYMVYERNGFEFSEELIDEIKAYFRTSRAQVRMSAMMDTPAGIVQLYGIIDYLCMDTAFDLKGTRMWEFGHFIKSWQHRVYPYICNENGIFIREFEYTITDYQSVFRESYTYIPDVDIHDIMNQCLALIDFLENHRHLITDKRVFALDNPSPDELFTF